MEYLLILTMYYGGINTTRLATMDDCNRALEAYRKVAPWGQSADGICVEVHKL